MVLQNACTYFTYAQRQAMRIGTQLTNKLVSLRRPDGVQRGWFRSAGHYVTHSICTFSRARRKEEKRISSL